MSAPDLPDLHRWLLETGDELEVDPDAMDIELLLDLAREVAHGVARPAVPLTCYLLGYAVARSGGDHDALDRLARGVSERAGSWRAGDE